MKLIREINTHGLEAITEGVGNSKDYFIKGIFFIGDTVNQNGRIYPLNVLTREVSRFVKEKVEKNSAIGELDHPSEGFNLKNASHKIVELRQEGNKFIGKAKIMDTPNGRIVKTLIDEGVPIGVSLRGFADLTKVGGKTYVGENFYLQTVDIVAEPSFSEAVTEGIYESKTYEIVNGVPVEKCSQDVLLESFTKFLDEI